MVEIRLYFNPSQPEQAQILRCVLLNAGIAEQKIVEELRKDCAWVGVFVPTAQKAQVLAKKLHALHLQKVKICCRIIKPSNWQSAWKKYFQPFNITSDIRLVPGWLKAKDHSSKQYKVYIDTTFAFGSGMHATTQLMAKLLKRTSAEYKSLLDIGTGSGILALIARCYGATDIWALDIDKQAVKTAQANFKLNRIKPRYLKAVSFEKFKSAKRFDFVAANLLTQDLVRLQDKLAGCVNPGKFLAISGIYRDNYALLRRSFKPKHMRCVGVLEKKGWYALLFQRNPNTTNKYQ